MEDLRKELRITRIMNGILAVLLVCVLAAVVFVGWKMHSYAEIVLPLAEKVSEVDFEVLNETMENLNESLNEIDWELLSDQMAQLDMDALNEAIAGLNTEEFSKALGNLNSTVEALNNFSNSIKSFFGK